MNNYWQTRANKAYNIILLLIVLVHPNVSAMSSIGLCQKR